MNAKCKKSISGILKNSIIMLAALICSPAAQARAQEAVDPDNLLFLDFTVSSNKSPGTELRPEQVQISVNGEKRDVAYFSKLAPESLRGDDPNSWIVANQLRGRHALIIALDLNSLDNAALNSTRMSIQAMLDELPDNHNKRIMLVTLGNQMTIAQSFTSDRSAVYEALNKLQAASRRMDYRSLIESISEIFTIQYDQNPAQAMDEAIREANQFLIQVRGRTQSLISGMELLTEWFAGLSGPKNILLFSGGYPMVPEPVVQDIIRAYNQRDAAGDIIPPSLLSAKMGSSGETAVSEIISSLVSRLNRNQTTIFSFDSRDVKSESLAASGIRWLPQRLVARHNSSHVTAGHEFLKDLSQSTGGELISDPGNILNAAAGSGRASYIAGIEAASGDEPGDQRLSAAIEIVDESGSRDTSIQVKSRNSLFRLLSGSSEEVLTGAFSFPYYHRDFSVSFNAGVLGDQVSVEAVIPPQSLLFIRERDTSFCMLEIFGLLTDSDGNPVTGDKKFTFARQFPIRMNNDQLQSLLERESVTAGASAPGIAAGEYDLTVVVRQPRTGMISASRMKIRVGEENQ